MVSFREVRLTSRGRDGSLLFPGVWVEVWVKDPATGVSMLVALRPKSEPVRVNEDEGDEAYA